MGNGSKIVENIYVEYVYFERELTVITRIIPQQHHFNTSRTILQHLIKTMYTAWAALTVSPSICLS